MIDIAHFILFLALGAGLVSIYIASQLYKQNKLKCILYYIFVLVGFNLITFAHTVETFIKSSTANDDYTSIMKAFFAIVMIILPTIRILSAYLLISIFHQLLEKQTPKWVQYFFYIFLSTFLLAQISYLVSPVLQLKIQYLSSMSVHFVFFSALFISLIFFISTAGKIENKKRKSALQWFGVFFLSYITLQLLHRVGDYSGILGLNVQMIIISCLVFTFYITQVLFMNKFFNYYNSPGIKESAIDFSILASKFGITNREKDIIKLVCEGKTNKEIGEELFITSITVRDHLSNIFRKTNVKRRVQLANLFRVNLSRKDKT